MYTLSERSEESIHTKTLLETFSHCQTSNPNLMLTPTEQKLNAVRRQLIVDLLDSHFSFDIIANTAAWDELTCDEQMTLADLIGTR